MDDSKLYQLNELIVAIYEARDGWDDWSSLLQRLSEQLGVAGAYLAVGAAIDPCPTGIGFGNLDTAAYLSHFYVLDPFIPIVSRLVLGRVYSHDELMSWATFERSEFYNDFVRESGEDPSLLSLVRGGAPSDRVSLILTLPSGRLTSAVQAAHVRMLVPHIVRAIQLGAERRALAAQRDALSRIREHTAGAVLLVDRGGRVSDSSANVEDVLAAIGGVRLSNGRLSFADLVTHSTFRRAVRDCVDATCLRRDQRSRRIPIRGATRQDSEVVVHASERDPARFAVAAESCVVVIDGGVDPLWSWNAFLARHRLSPSEAALVELLARGDSLRGAAEKRGLTFESARTYLKRIFAKTGVRRQAELIALVQRSLHA